MMLYIVSKQLINSPTKPLYTVIQRQIYKIDSSQAEDCN
uniref:Uncharacterized protein n=1 Tax=Anguilla anguilla TaxID=7936 RepID=A0A0E9RAH6_ANGAN